MAFLHRGCRNGLLVMVALLCAPAVAERLKARDIVYPLDAQPGADEAAGYNTDTLDCWEDRFVDVKLWACLSSAAWKGFLKLLDSRLSPGDLVSAVSEDKGRQFKRVLGQSEALNALPTKTQMYFQTVLDRFVPPDMASAASDDLGEGLLEVDWDRLPETPKEPKEPNATRQWEKDSWRVADCPDCSVELYGKTAFSELLTVPGGRQIREDLVASLRGGPLVPLSPGAGKSGSGFAGTTDGKFMIKLGIREDEVSSMRDLVYGSPGSRTLRQYLSENPKSLLNRYYGLIKVSVLNGKASFALLMDDATYGYAKKIKEKNPPEAKDIYQQYDLKSQLDRKSNDDNSPTLLNSEFVERENNRLYITRDQCRLFRQAVHADAEFLSSYHLVDWSILLTVTHKPNARVFDAFPTCSLPPPSSLLLSGHAPVAEQPVCFENGDVKYTVSIIDYLIPYNLKKITESMIPIPSKWGKFMEYGKKLGDFANTICLVEYSAAFES